jgi:fructosamine-3-kinase
MGSSYFPVMPSLDEPGCRSANLPNHGAACLRWVLDEVGMVPNTGSVENLSPQQVVSLAGGADALTYLVRCPGRDVVVKLSDHGLEAEARALRAWKARTRWVPDVLGVGTVPSAGARPVKYLLLSALVNDEGAVVETAAEYLDRSPEDARAVGRELGVELQAMHEARCRTGFGNFADSPGAGRTYATWSSYLEEFFLLHADYVRSVGIRNPQIEKACAFVRQCRYVDEARYVHGDVSIRNIAMRSYDPVRISLFDPNPLSGDPSWDIAPMTNNVEFNERRHQADDGAEQVLRRDRDLLAGFWDSYPDVITDSSLLTAQLVQAVLQAEHRARASATGETDDLDVEVTHAFIRDLMDRMSA